MNSIAFEEKKNTKENKIKQQLSILNITESKYQNKEWRKVQEWYYGGKKNECEKYQRNMLSSICGREVIKTNLRLNIISNQLETVSKPLTYKGGFSYTEDFDGKITLNGITFLINLKMICNSGGAQTRSIREVYHFISSQCNYLSNQKNNNIYFVNILDGNEGYKFTYGNREKENPAASLFDIFDNIDISIKNRVFIGDLYNFSKFLYMNNYISLANK